LFPLAIQTNCLRKGQIMCGTLQSENSIGSIIMAPPNNKPLVSLRSLEENTPTYGIMKFPRLCRCSGRDCYCYSTRHLDWTFDDWICLFQPWLHDAGEHVEWKSHSNGGRERKVRFEHFVRVTRWGILTM
jgi:hypothetical protein